jgi:GntR family transcriptional repressor for pyruvate dehydrogenase complex
MDNAYEQVAAMLIDQIVQGEHANGDRLPSETELANQFGVSRTTVREALRLLTARGLIRTAKGMRGGSYIQVPTVQHIAASLRTSLNVLSAAEHLSVEELLEARELLEVPAARLAAARRDEPHLLRLKESIKPRGSEPDANVEFAHNADFHGIVLSACGNTLLAIAAEPVFAVLREGFQRTSLGATFQEQVRDQHREIAHAIERGDRDAAATLMHEHLEYLRPTYERLPRRWPATQAEG